MRTAIRRLALIRAAAGPLHLFAQTMAASASKNLLAQTLNFTPGTSLVGNFGSTDERFRPNPVACCDWPAPDAYEAASALDAISRSPPLFSMGPYQRRIKHGGGTSHQLANRPELHQATPGPGAYGLEQTLNSNLTELRRRWPGIASKSAFGSNGKREPFPTGDVPPGPGAYHAVEASYFVSGAGRPNVGARCPFLAQARTVTGSRLQRDIDLKVGAVFASRTERGPKPPVDSQAAAASDIPRDSPGPGAHSPLEDTIGQRHERATRRLELRSDRGERHHFGSTATRFSEAGMSAPAPGAHDVRRWDGSLHTCRRARRPARPAARPVSHAHAHALRAAHAAAITRFAPQD